MRLDVAFVDSVSAPTTLLLLLSTLVSFQRALTTDEPQFLVQPQSMVVAPQGEVTLQCEPRDPSTQILWVFNGEFISSSARDGVEITGGLLHIRSFRHRRSDGRNQAGVYQCIARNSVGAVISREAVVQQAYFGKFEEGLKDLYVKSTEGNVAVIPCHPPTGNPSTLTAFEVNGSGIDLKSGRYYILPSGNLQISPVRPIDQGQYRCLAINPVSGQQQRAPNTVHLKVVAPVTNSPPRIVQRPPDTKTTVTQGQNLTLECVVEGAPVPVVTWDKYGGHLPEGRYTQLLGNLMIQNMQVQDQGTYICRAENQVGQPQAAIATVDVIEPPVIRVAPVSETVEEGGKVSLQCLVEGTTDTIHWLHNAVTLHKDSSIKITDTALTISDVQLRHAGMYQCVARSKLGSDYATARLQVRPIGWLAGPSPFSKVRRSIIHVAPSNLTGRVGDTVELACPGSRGRSADPHWHKDDLPLDTTAPSSRYVLLQSGTLRIVNLRRGDAGKYVCTMSGAAGQPSTVTAAFLTITETSESGDSLDGAVGSGTNSSRTDPGRQQPGGRRRGRKNGRKGRTQTRRKRPEAQEEEEETDSQNEEPQGSAKLIPPSRPKVTQLSDTSVMLRWKVPDNDGLSVTFFKVQYKEMTADKRRRRWHTIDEDILSSSRMYEVSGLRPGSMYKFRVLAVFSNNDNKQSPNSRKFTLEMAPAHMPKAPAAGPVIVEARPVSPNAISITWQYLPVDQAPIEGYFVYHKPYEASDADYKKQTLLGPTRSSHLLTELRPNTQYSIKMRCFNAAGYSDESNTVVKKTLSASGHPNQREDGTDLFPGGPPGNRPVGGTARPSSETSLDDIPNTTNTKQSNELLYLVLGTVLGGMMLLLIGLMAMCAWRQQQQSRMMAAMGGRNKFDDPARVIHTDSLRKQTATGNGFLLKGLNGQAGNGHVPNHGQTNGSRPQMNISVNPMTELEEDKYTDGRRSPHVDQWLQANERSEPPQLIQPPPPPFSYSGGSASHLDDSDQLSMENLDRQPYSECSGSHQSDANSPDYNSHERWQHRGQQDRSSHDLHANNRTSLDHIPRSHERLPYRGVRTDPLCDSSERVSDHSHSSSSQLSGRHRQRRKDSSGEGSTRDQATNTDLSSNEDSVNVTTPCLRAGHSDSSHDTSLNLGGSPAPPYHDLPRVTDYPPSDQE